MQRYEPSDIYLDTSRALFIDRSYYGILNVLEYIIKDIIGKQVEELAKVKIPKGENLIVFKEDYEAYLQKDLGTFESFANIRKNFIESLEKELIDKGIIEMLTLSFDTIADTIRVASSSLDFRKDYYYLLSEIYYYSPETLYSLVVAGELKKKILERLEREDK